MIGLQFGWIAVNTALAKNRGLVSVLALGILGGFVATYVHGLAEWAIRQTPLFYLFWMLMGLLVAINRMRVEETDETVKISPLVEREPEACLVSP